MKRLLPIHLSQRLKRVIQSSLVFSALLAPARGTAAEASATGLPSGLQLAPGLSATVWAADPLVQNPVAISFDDRGRCYTAETHRWSQSIFDITRQPTWLLEDLSFRTVSDRSNFLSKTFSTNFHQLTKDSERVTWVEDRSGVDARMSAVCSPQGFKTARRAQPPGCWLRATMSGSPASPIW